MHAGVADQQCLHVYLVQMRARMHVAEHSAACLRTA